MNMSFVNVFVIHFVYQFVLPCFAVGTGNARIARWAGPDRDFGKAMAQVHEKLGRNPNRRAYFVSALALAWPDGHVECFEGRVHGDLVWPPRGDQGFGYDPMFLPDGRTQTFGEIPYAEKQRISHRAVAFQKLIDGCFKTA